MLRASLGEIRKAIAEGVIRDPLGPSDPPTYESQATYLERHGLLLPGEKRHLEPADYEAEIVTDF